MIPYRSAAVNKKRDEPADVSHERQNRDSAG